MNHCIANFGGDHSNATLFGYNLGAANIIAQLCSNVNLTRPLLSRTIVQSAIVEPNPPDLHSAGWQVPRALAQLLASSVAQLRALDPESLVNVNITFRLLMTVSSLGRGSESFFSLPQGQKNLSKPLLKEV
ncbi:hypothetical protein AZE42_11736 [Rhizopogon vesiculosus]|uniref:Carboxylesterase type B domain-containing protein n=1 Tax=Rhizopogon vesiculosus TaxID=180088 RepID=A0A1J8R773_9AGAM|nr:hypothetical protein AZE42_11736 [Rhizopogon vesiculosus]